MSTVSSWPLLPYELKSHICSFSLRSTLATIAILDTSSQFAAEETLYSRISFFYNEPVPFDTACLKTLETIPRKAALVRQLQVGLGRGQWTDDRAEIASQIRRLIPALVNLTDLRIQLPFTVKPVWLNTFESIIRYSTFRLQTLYCNMGMNIKGILYDQPELTMLGIYTTQPEDIASELRERVLPEEDSFISPFIVGLTHIRENNYYDCVSLFPGFHQGTSDALFRKLRASFLCDMDPASGAESFLPASSVSIYLRNDTRVDHLAFETLQAVIRHCPQVDTWVLPVEELPVGNENDTFLNILSQAPKLSWLRFGIWDNSNSPFLAEPSNLRKARELGRVCPNLRNVCFPDGMWAHKGEDMGWSRLDW